MPIVRFHLRPHYNHPQRLPGLCFGIYLPSHGVLSSGHRHAHITVASANRFLKNRIICGDVPFGSTHPHLPSVPMVVRSNGCISTPFPAAINSVTVHVWEEEVVLLVQFEMKEVIISIPCANIISLYISISLYYVILIILWMCLYIPKT